MNEEALLSFRDRFELEITDEQVRNISFYKPPEGSPEAEFIREQRAELGGSLPRSPAQGRVAARRRSSPPSRASSTAPGTARSPRR